MKNILHVLGLAVICVLTSTSADAQVKEGVPIEKAPVINVKKVPKQLQKEFKDQVDGNGLQLVGTPTWTRQSGLYIATFRAIGDSGPGSGFIRLKPYGGTVLFDFKPDNAATTGTQKAQ